MKAPGEVTPAREVAFRVLGRMERTMGGTDDVLDSESKAANLSVSDRALAYEITYGVLRWRRRLDAALARFTDRGVPDDERVQVILRAAAYQLIFLDRVPASAAVNTAVEALKGVGREGMAGFANAVLRKVAKAAAELAAETPAADAGHAEWAQFASYPDWMVDALAEAIGEDALQPLLLAGNVRPPLTLRARPGTRASVVADLREALRAEVREGRWAPEAITIHGGVGAVGELPGLATRFWVQDESSQLASLLLDPQPGEAILDVGAAPGGKTVHIRELLGKAGVVTALDVNRKRLEKMERSLADFERGIDFVVGDAAGEVSELAPASFDRVLVDAPCSALGIIRRKPDVKWSRVPEDVPRLAAKQASVLDGASKWVRRGGILLYSVCTLSLAETVETADAFTTRHDDFERLPVPAHFRAFDFDGDFRALPSTHGTDGFYCARWRRRN